MKKIVSALLLGASIASAHAAIREVDTIVAVVDGEVITAQELTKISNEIRQTVPKGQTPPPGAVEQQALQQLVDESILVQHARRNGVQVSNNEITEAMMNLAQSNKMSLPQLQAQLEREGISQRQFTDMLRNNIMRQKITQQEIFSRVHITESEIDQEMKSAQVASFAKQNLPAGATTTQYHVNSIMLKIDGQASPEASKKQIDALYKRLQQGERFEALARQYSQDANAASGGDLGWVNQGALSPEIEQALQTLKPSEFSAPVQTPYGWQILQLVDRRQENAAEAELRNIVRQRIGDRKADQIYRSWMSQMRDSAHIDIRLGR
ncbi:MAG: peptidylprolyl isomerase [Neisseriaceae bacterium]|nr:peptidylprolyl isomerase [Neisseriaceae bacterium]